MASEAEDEYNYSDDEDYPVESDDDEGMDWEDSNPNAAPVIMGGGKGKLNSLVVIGRGFLQILYRTYLELGWQCLTPADM